MFRKRRRSAEFGIALLCAVGAVVLGLFLMPLTGNALPYLAIFAATMFAAMVGGSAAGMLCFILAVAASVLIFFGGSPGALWQEAPSLIVATAMSMLSIIIASIDRRWRQRADRATDESQAAQREIAFLNAKLQATVDSALDPLLTMNAQGILLSACRSVERVFGWKPEELVGHNVSMLMPEPYRSKHDGYLQRYRETGRTAILGATRELIAVRRNGEEFPILLSVERVRAGVGGAGGDEAGQAGREGELFVGIIHDISDLKTVEAELARRTRELARSNADLEEYARVVAHDLKEPLRGITTYATIVEQDLGKGLSEEDRDRLATIRSLGFRMDQLLSGVLQHARVGSEALDLADCDMGKVAQDAVESLRTLIEEHKARVIIRREGMPRMKADPMRVHQVFTNLIANGLKYNESEQKQIEIGCCCSLLSGAAPPSAPPLSPPSSPRPPPERSGGGYAGAAPVFFVRDNGIGIQVRHRTVVFEIFRRLNGRSKYGGGTGTGLPIVKKIIERHQGRIWLESEPGRGTTFYFTLGEPIFAHDLAGETIRQIDTMLAAGAPWREILAALTAAGERIAPAGSVCSILILDEEGLLRNGASPHLPDHYLAAIDRLKPNPGVGTCAAAAATGSVVMTPSFLADVKWDGLRHLPMSLGFNSAWSMPILTGDKRVLGTFGTYYREARSPSRNEVKQIESLARAASKVLASRSSSVALKDAEA